MAKNIKGLTEDEVIKSREKNGSNSLEKEKHKGFFGKFIENLSDPIIRVLLMAVFIEIAFTIGHCNWWETGGIIAAVLIATTVSTVSEYGSERAFEKMEEANLGTSARVIRDGKMQEIPLCDIVVGDILFVKAGEIAGADGEIIEGRISADQSALNGESAEVSKYPIKEKGLYDLCSPGCVFRGSLVCEGEGTIRVGRVGKDTYYGMVAKDIQAETRESPLKLRLKSLASAISKLGYVMALIVGLTYLFFTFIYDNGYDFDRIMSSVKDIPFLVTNLTHALTLMITVVVVAVPEGLPMMITVVLSANMKKMMKDNIMVKKLVGIETAGSMNILFTDKTGTLTTGRVTVDRIITSDNSYKQQRSILRAKEICKYLNISAKEGASSFGGNSTDKALLAFFEEIPDEDIKIISRMPFSSERKFSSVTLDSGDTVIKGAPELIISSCTSAFGDNGIKHSFDGYEMLCKYREAASHGERAIAVSLKKQGGECIFIALVVLKDKLRTGAKTAVGKMLSAGVQVVMITGDGKETAAAIAEECGILPKGRYEGVLTRDELSSMSDEEVKAILPRLRVVSRALPTDKTRLVRLSQELNLVVGMTGDGINDAPSLKLADIGFSMGSGTDIAKSASDIVILDNSFTAITKSVLYGRTIFKSIRKFISFQLMMNITACGVSLIGQFIGIENPITIIQMLWINIIMDTLGGLAFAGEAPLDYYMMEKPKSREEQIVSRDMLHQIMFTGGYTLLLCIMFLRLDFFKSLFRYDISDRYFLTGFYALFVFSGIFNCFNSRSERLSILSNIGKNRTFLFIMAMIASIQLLMVYFGGEVFRSIPLTFREVLNVVLISSTVVIVDIIRRTLKKIS